MKLKKITAMDSDLLAEWRNKNAEFFPPGHLFTLETQADWFFGKYLTDPVDHMYIICDPYPVGTIAINVREQEIHRVMRGCNGGDKGAMSRAVVELMRVYGFAKYYLHVIDGNERALAFYLDLNFTVEGRCVHKETPFLYMSREFV